MKWHRTAGNILIFLGGLAIIGSAGAKFAQVPQVVSELNGFGFEGKLMLIATGEAVSAAVRGRQRSDLVHPELLRPRDHRESGPARVAVVREIGRAHV